MSEELSVDQMQHRIEGIEKHIHILVEQIEPAREQLTRLREEHNRLTVEIESRLNGNVNGA